jgi:hypothetical protein
MKTPASLTSSACRSQAALRALSVTTMKAGIAILALAGSSALAQVVTISPPSVCMVVSGTQPFSAAVSGTTNTAVTWQVDNVTGGTTNGGKISQTGFYTAPASSGTHFVKAISQANANSVDVAQVTVRSSAGVLIQPTSAAVPASTSFTFAPTICGLTNTSVSWQVDGIANGNSGVGTVSGGVYTAPGGSGTHTVKVIASNGASASATVHVFSSISVDFGSRAYTAHPVPANMTGAQLGYQTNGFYNNATALGWLKSGGITTLRVDSGLQNIFPNAASVGNPSWGTLDAILAKLNAAGLKVLLIVGYTPGWLQPSPNPCGTSSTPYHAAPTNVSQWAGLAGLLVQHINATYPKGFVIGYEIWNEPDNALALCTSPSTDAQRRSTYVSMYAAAASQIAKVGGLNIGGPALTTYGNAVNWVPALVNNASTYPYVNFVSYHYYVGGLSTTQAGMLWDNPSGPQSVSYHMQDGGAGAAATYKTVYKYVKAGLQANAASTPIYLDEYNTTATYSADCCRNQQKYAPLFNAMMVQDALSLGNSSLPFPRLYYFAAQDWFPNAPGASFFCLIGVLDSAMDCAYNASTLANDAPYPQYYAYKLISGSLGLARGGFLSKTPYPPIDQAGILVSGFYTVGASPTDAVVITNPTSINYSSITVNLLNAFTTAPSSAAATLYTLNPANRTIASQSLPLTVSGNGFTVKIAVPAYSVLGISLPAH